MAHSLTLLLCISSSILVNLNLVFDCALLICSLQRITASQNKVVITDRMWARLLSSTNQPSFMNHPDEAVSDGKEEENSSADHEKNDESRESLSVASAEQGEKPPSNSSETAENCVNEQDQLQGNVFSNGC